MTTLVLHCKQSVFDTKKPVTTSDPPKLVLLFCLKHTCHISYFDAIDNMEANRHLFDNPQVSFVFHLPLVQFQFIRIVKEKFNYSSTVLNPKSVAIVPKKLGKREILATNRDRVTIFAPTVQSHGPPISNMATDMYITRTSPTAFYLNALSVLL